MAQAGPFDAVFCVGQFLAAGCTSEADDAAGQGPAQEKTAEEELADFQRRADESELKDYLNGTKEGGSHIHAIRDLACIYSRALLCSRTAYVLRRTSRPPTSATILGQRDATW